MNRRLPRVYVLLVCSCTTLAGCEWLHQSLRPKDRDPEVAHATAEAAEADSQKVLDVQADSSNPRRFFKPSRLPSALSPEGREIENSLGIH